MVHPMGESKNGLLRVDFDRRVKLEFPGSKVTSDGGLLAYRELDDALGLTEMAAGALRDGRRGKNGWHAVVGMLRQAVFGRLAGYEDVNDAERLSRDPAMRWIVGGKATDRGAASSSQMGRFETQWLTGDVNLTALSALSGLWIDRVHRRKPPKLIILDMDSSVSPTHGEQEGTAYNGHFGCTCYHPLFVFNQLGDLERCALRPGNVHSADGWRAVLDPVVARYRERKLRRYFRGDAAFASPDIYEYLDIDDRAEGEEQDHQAEEILAPFADMADQGLLRQHNAVDGLGTGHVVAQQNDEGGAGTDDDGVDEDRQRLHDALTDGMAHIGDRGHVRCTAEAGLVGEEAAPEALRHGSTHATGHGLVEAEGTLDDGDDRRSRWTLGRCC